MESSSSWPRIADDLRRSTGRELVLRDVSDLGEAEAGWVNIEVYLDGAALGSFRHGGHSPDVEVFITELADDLTEFVHDKRISGAWPTCPDHGTDPVEADAIDGVACWRCPVDGRVVSVIGSLGSA
jgi:hypothetical protein